MINRRRTPQPRRVVQDSRPVAAHRAERARVGELRVEVRDRLARADDLRRSTGCKPLAALREVGLPPGTWETLAGASRPTAMPVAWHKRGRDYRNERHTWSYQHRTTGGGVTLCGYAIPPADGHDIAYDQTPARHTCATCERKARKGARHGG